MGGNLRRSMRMLLVLVLVMACGRQAMCGVPSGAENSAAPDLSAYKLGAGDKIRVTVFNEEALSGEFEVNGAGAVSLPLLGDVAASGHTTRELAGDVQRLLGADYIRDPKVSIEVSSYRPYFILGEIKTPGRYPFQNDLTVTNAIATAGGFTTRANKGTVYIRRSGAEREEPHKVTPDLRVFPGDTIRLAERFF